MRHLTIENFKKALGLVLMLIGIIAALTMAWSPLVFMMYGVYALMVNTYENFWMFLVDVVTFSGLLFFSAMAILLLSKFIVGMLDLK